nr:hypothetical protein GCM10020092_060970 [Actinoplanes digitatis]
MALAEATYRPGPANEIGSLESVRVRPGELVLDEGGELTAALGAPDRWTVTGPLATAYAWSGDRLLIDLIFVETPHRLHLRLDPATGTFAASWRTAPLAPRPPSSHSGCRTDGRAQSIKLRPAHQTLVKLGRGSLFSARQISL